MLNQIVIAGGGTSGWMAAIAISARFPDKTITVVDPSKLSPIGVGESVSGVVLQFVADPRNGLSLSQFFQETDATLKLGIRFEGWLGSGKDYLAAIDLPNYFFRHHYAEDIEAFYALATRDGIPLGEYLIHGRLISEGKTDYYRKPDGSISGDMAQASCHFDALKFAAWLKREAVSRSNVIHFDDSIDHFERNAESGLVEAVITEAGRKVEGHFFLDCTGFRRRLLGESFDPRWIDYSAYLKTDRAVVAFTPREQKKVPVCTTAKAMPHGWKWEIPVGERLGHGYVYSSCYASDEQAIAELRASGIDPGENPRIIPFEAGKFENQWIGNVCAIGMAGGFLEPLESTTVHIINAQIQSLVELFLPYASETESLSPLARKYNALMDLMYEDLVDFVSFHYQGGRTDTDFWRDYQKPESITSENQMRMEKWKYSYPVREDFIGIATQRFVLHTGMAIWMPMLCGMKQLNPRAASVLLDATSHPDFAKRNQDSYIKARDYLCAHAVSQEEAIQYLRKDS